MEENYIEPIAVSTIPLDEVIVEPEEDVYTYPSLQKRIQSIIIDSLMIVIGMVLIGIILNTFSEVPVWIRIFGFVSLWGIYEPFCMAFGCTAGNAVAGIRLRKFSNKEKGINLFQSYVRYIFKIALGWLSFLVITSNHERRAIHDLISGSVMIEL